VNSNEWYFSGDLDLFNMLQSNAYYLHTVRYDHKLHCCIWCFFSPLITLETSSKVSRLITQALEFLAYRLRKPL